jgi:hypothetical protein
MYSNLPEPIAVTLLVIDVLEKWNIPYVVVGSLASTLHGTTRSTLDSDLVVKLNESEVPLLISPLQDAFYVDENMALNAIRNKSSFNLIHLETMFKVDIFIAKDELFDRTQIERRVPRAVAKDLDREIYVLSAEDTILAKLRWYRMGGEQSEQQWHDVVGVVKVQGERLDFEYLHKMAAELRVGDLLARLLG